jgi:acyl-coenzyme A thioesterase 9
MRFNRKYLSQAAEEKRLQELESQGIPTDFIMGAKKPRDSLIEHTLPLSTDKQLRDLYSTEGQRGVRIGRLLEDLDALAGEISYKHADGFNKKRPITIVTASVDRIELQTNLIPFFDLKLTGWVTWVGSSSMEVRMEVSTIDATGAETQAMVAYFMMVARDKYTNQAAPVHRLEPETEDDRYLYDMGEENKQRRKVTAAQSLSLHPPNPEEAKLIHDIFLTHQKNQKLGIVDPDIVPMKSTVTESTKIMQPQQRNIHQKIFGGYILRQGFELAYITAYIFSHHRPKFIALDDNSFLKPVEIGSVVDFTAQIVYAEKELCTVQVIVEVIHPESGKREITNVLHFSFSYPVEKRVIPSTYQEAILYIEGKRLYEKSKKMSQILRRNLH